MATDNKDITSLGATNLRAIVSKLNTRLARQENAVQETKAHIQSIESLIRQVEANLNATRK